MAEEVIKEPWSKDRACFQRKWHPHKIYIFYLWDSNINNFFAHENILGKDIELHEGLIYHNLSLGCKQKTQHPKIFGGTQTIIYRDKELRIGFAIQNRGINLIN